MDEMNLNFDFYLDDSTIKELDSAADMSLSAPSFDENETFRPGKKDGLGTWTELFKVRETALTPPKDGKKDGSQIVFKVTLEVLGGADGGFDKNAGKVHYYNAFIDKGTLADKSDKMYPILARRIGTINSLLKAVGVPMETGGVNYKEWFEGTDGDKPMVGQIVKGTVRKYEYDNKRTGEKGVRSVDIDGFSAL